MASVGELSDELNELIMDEGASAAGAAERKRLLNYLNLFADREDPLTQSTFLEYLNAVQVCLPNDTEFQNEVAHVLGLERALEDTPLLANIDFSLIQSLIETEFFDFKHTTNELENIRKFLSRKAEKHAKVQVIKREGEGAISLVLGHKGDLNVSSYKRVKVLKGEIRPVWSGTRVQYDCRMFLAPEQTHFLRLTRSRLALIAPQSGGKYEVSIVELPSFELIESHIVENLREYEPIFFELKKIERLFLDRSSDPFYQETCQSIESALKKLAVIGERQITPSRAVLESGQRILDEVFVHDKLLTFLLKDLETRINECQESVSYVPGSQAQQVSLTQRSR